MEDQSYHIVLQADPRRPWLTSWTAIRMRRAACPTSFVYVFVIDSSGSGRCWCFRRAGRQTGAANHLPAAPDRPRQAHAPRAEIPISTKLTIGPPFGVDSYMLLTTATALGNPDVLNFSGPGGTRGAGNGALEGLLGGLGEGSRGVRIPTPSDWSIQRVFIHSVPK